MGCSKSKHAKGDAAAAKASPNAKASKKEGKDQKSAKQTPSKNVKPPTSDNEKPSNNEKEKQPEGKTAKTDLRSDNPPEPKLETAEVKTKDTTQQTGVTPKTTDAEVPMAKCKVFFDIAIDQRPAGRITMELRGDVSFCVVDYRIGVFLGCSKNCRKFPCSMHR